ncbi:MAG: hypothetical protein JW941_10300, partial [Candidatus Coatesbacteria bacterium]|nr:hypothetical protein [Candidatus Coatesbacteria bacterium]
RLSITASISTSRDLTDCTAYVAVLDPSGNLLFLPSFSSESCPLGFSVPSGQTIRDLPILDVEIVPWIERGKYLWMVGAFDSTQTPIDGNISTSPVFVR